MRFKDIIIVLSSALIHLIKGMSGLQWYPVNLYFIKYWANIVVFLAWKVFDSDYFLPFYLKNKGASHFWKGNTIEDPQIPKGLSPRNLISSATYSHIYIKRLNFGYCIECSCCNICTGLPTKDETVKTTQNSKNKII